jgi:ApaG protein
MQLENIIYQQTTSGIEVRVHPLYLPSHSKPEQSVYVWAYEVEILNHSSKAHQLMSRHWKIINAHGQTFEVKGPGVVGAQPLIHPGSTYSYSSFVNLGTSSGFMSGSYHMIMDGGEPLEVLIPPFSLDSPEARPLLN